MKYPLTMPQPGSNPRPRSRRLGASAARIPITPAPQRPTKLGPVAWAMGVPLMTIALIIMVAIPVFTFLYAVFGTSIPFLVNARSTDPHGPAPIGQRLVAATLFVASAAVLASVAVRLIRRWIARPALAVDPAGIWLTRGNRIEQGLEWARIAAVAVVESPGRTTVPAADVRPPLVEIFPIDAPTEDPSPLGSRVVNAPSPGHRLRGKRYVVGVRDTPETPAALAAVAGAIDSTAPGKRIH